MIVLKVLGVYLVDIAEYKVREHLSGRGNWQHHLWSVLMFQAWLEREGVTVDSGNRA